MHTYLSNSPTEKLEDQSPINQKNVKQSKNFCYPHQQSGISSTWLQPATKTFSLIKHFWQYIFFYFFFYNLIRKKIIYHIQEVLDWNGFCLCGVMSENSSYMNCSRHKICVRQGLPVHTGYNDLSLLFFLSDYICTPQEWELYWHIRKSSWGDSIGVDNSIDF